jgi:hypothetical protein
LPFKRNLQRYNPGSVVGSSNSTCTAAGFYCDGATTSFGCWGRSGKQVLQTLHMTYESLDIKDDRALDVAILLAMVAALKLGFVFVLWRKSTATDAPHASAVGK